MPVGSERELRQILFDAYGGFADKRIRNIERNELFIVDDRRPSDHDARKQLFYWFCQMFLLVEADNQVKLTFRGGTPTSTAIDKWLKAHGAEFSRSGIALVITPENLDALDGLSQQFKAILSKKYDTAAYKYVVPRTAASLIRLRKVLQKAWSE